MTAPQQIHHWAVVRCASICEHKGVSFNEFCGKGRHPSVVECREIAAYILREFRGPSYEHLSFPEISAAMGRGNHSTIITGYRRVCGSIAAMEEAERVAAYLGITSRVRKQLVRTATGYERLLKTGDTREQIERTGVLPGQDQGTAA